MLPRIFIQQKPANVHFQHKNTDKSRHFLQLKIPENKIIEFRTSKYTTAESTAK